MRGLIGKKIGMTRVFDEGGRIVPVTVIEAGPCLVTQVKTAKRDGYEAVQVGFGDRKLKHTTKPLQGHFEAANISAQKVLVEFDKVPGFDYKSGQSFHVGLFNEGEFVSVSGTSKGKGFAGVIKRHNFARQRKTHGNGHTERAPGSIGQASDPSRVFPGMRMAGHHGNSKVTVENLEVVKVDIENNQLLVKGAVPGARNGTVIISK
ncbi:MAG: 50S ribosomal protein L3 [Candidatus Marinimicrobia bacterium]|jgi:large subunit ribosomal protein L3|nr:50S ribosomal protein L3 [Candidatus Neomarinimicrobiota bacterium]MBT4155476.1 50S ribosomal protein L3 [Candidatus Neomarinimicrobiota bacterium]MBT4752653.1 50S ribosomal protein L3 [Candidatus Neomarinimicrobiota bacterium]MBT6796746.1 50S ribosomal protein L3 [Candidatus Neomarinimicrobiota bacterium]